MKQIKAIFLELKYGVLTLWWVLREIGYVIKSFCMSRLRLMWAKAYIRKDEFHSSLDIDIEYLSTATEKQKESYFRDLVKRRNIAHERDFH